MPLLKHACDFFRTTVEQFVNDDCPAMAAALAYHGIFALPGVLVLVIWIAGAIFGRSAAEGRLKHEIARVIGERYTYAIYRKDKSEHLADNLADPYQMHNLAGDAGHHDTLERGRAFVKAKLAENHDTFPASTWYRDHWTRDRIILRGAKD